MRINRSRGNVFVGNLPPDFSDEALAEAFDAHGIVLRATVARDPSSGKKLRYGFVDIATERAAERAVAAMNGVSIDGHQIDVRRAERPQKAQRPALQKPARAVNGTPAPARRKLAHLDSEPSATADLVEELPTAPKKRPNFVVERRPLPRRI